MDVSVLSKQRQRSLRSAVRASVLGNGLLERTRSTSLALLGLTAAIGLAMVALALNQGFPLIAGAPIPGLGDGHQAVGEAAAVPTAGTQSGRAIPLRAAGNLGSADLPGTSKQGRGKTATVAGARAPGSAHLVVSSPTPVSPVGESPPASGATEPVPVAQQPAPVPTSTPAPATEPPAAPVPVSSPSTSSPGSVPQTAPESPTTSQTPPAGDESNEHEHDESDEHDHGHHYGGGMGRGHGHSRGDDQDTHESGESPEAAPAPGEDSAPEAEVDEPNEPESGQSHLPSWGHGGGHGYGHGHW